MSDDLPPKTLDQLVQENATCLELALYGYFLLYEKGKAPCQCSSCVSYRKTFCNEK